MAFVRCGCKDALYRTAMVKPNSDCLGLRIEDNTGIFGVIRALSDDDSTSAFDG